MKPSATKNKTTATGFQYVLVELGDFLFFGGSEFLEVTHFGNGDNSELRKKIFDTIKFMKIQFDGVFNDDNNTVR